MSHVWQGSLTRNILTEVLQQFLWEYVVNQGDILMDSRRPEGSVTGGLVMEPITARLNELKEASFKALAEHKKVEEQIKACDIVIAAQMVVRTASVLACTQAVEAMTRIRREKTAFTQNVMATLDQSILGEEVVAANAAAVEMEVILARTATAAAGRQQPSYTSAAGMGAHKVQGRGGQPLLERREASPHWQVSQVVPFMKLQRDSAKALWPAPVWLQEGDKTTVLVVSGLRGDAAKFAGAARTYIRKALGPEITP
ncbi:hypothetical protein LPJ71_001358, partial [Coemansia sp. S17]